MCGIPSFDQVNFTKYPIHDKIKSILPANSNEADIQYAINESALWYCTQSCSVPCQLEDKYEANGHAKYVLDASKLQATATFNQRTGVDIYYCPVSEKEV